MILPPGLEPPPGLALPRGRPEGLAPPPGLEKPTNADEQSSSPMYISSRLCPPVPGVSVQISSLPNHLLSDAMMSVTLEQAKLEKYVSSIKTKPGRQRGEALITLTTTDAAIRCILHFNGRRWDASGFLVSAWLLPTQQAPLKQPRAPKTSFKLSAQATEFVPGALQTLTSCSLPTIGSDVSTEDGESAASPRTVSDEKDVVS